MAKLHNALATTELHNPKGIGVESSTEILLTMSASLGAVSASASIVPHTADTYDLGSATQRWNNITAAGNISSSLTSTGSFGRLEIAKNATIDGTLTLAGGTTTIGDAASDTLVITADLASNLIPDADGTRDLGSSAASWRNVWLDGTGSFKNTITTNRAYFNDAGGEYISGDGTDLNLVSSADINIPADIGLTFGDDGEKIEGDGTDLTISGNNINLTAVADVNIPSGVGLTFATGEKIESDGTDLSITVGGSGDINIPANIGMTFGDDGEKIEGDGTDLTIAGNNINLTAVADVNIPSGVGLTFATAEKIESDGTDLSITVGGSGDINIPANIGLTFGDDGEKIEGDGTDLTIAGNNINLTATADVVVPADVGITFGTGEKIEGNNTDLTVTSGADINLTAVGDVNIPSGVGVTFGDDGEKIEGDGTDLTVASSAALTLDVGTDLAINVDGGDVTFHDDAAHLANISISKISGSATSTGSFAEGRIINKLGINESAPAEALEVGGNVSGSGTGSFHHGLIRQRLYAYDAGGEFISGDGTDMTLNSGADINLTATADVNIPSGVGVTFGDDGEKIEGNGTDLTIASSNELNLSATTDVVIPVDVGLHFGDGAEKIESNNTALTINSGEDINLTATTDINVPSGVGLTFGNDGEKIEGNGTNLTIAGGDINLTAEADVNIPADIGLTFGDDGEKIEGDGTDMTIASSGILTLSSGGNTIIETVTLNDGNVTIPGNLTVTGDRLEAQVGSLQVADHTITVGSGSATSALMQNGGIDWGISGSIAFLRYRHAGTAISSSVFLEAPKLTVDTITLDAAEIDASGALDIDTGGDLTLSATGDVNIPANIGLTFGDDGEKIEGDGTDLTVASSAKLNLTATSDVHIPKNVGLVFDDNASEKIESNNTDLTVNSGADINLTAVGDVNIPSGVGVTFGDDGEKIEGDGTDLTIAGAKINLSPGTDVHIPNDKGVVFGDDGEKIEGDGTDLTIASSNDLHLTATTDINVPANVGMTFGNDGEKIEGDGTDLTISANIIKLNSTVTSGSSVSTGSFGRVEASTIGGTSPLAIDSDNLVLDTDGNLSGSGTGSFHHGLIRQRLYTYDAGGEFISGNGTALTLNSGEDINLTATTDINVPADVGLTFGNDGEKIEGDGTDLTIAGNNINLTAVADVVIPNDVGIQFGGASEKIEGDGTDLTIAGADINLTAVGDVNIPSGVGVTYGNDGEKIEGDGTDLTIASSNLLNLTATTDVVIPTNVGLHFTDSAEKIESDGTDLTINSGAKINLTATSDVHIPNDVGIVFGGASEKIEGDGTDLVISANNLTVDAAADIVLDAGGNDTVIKSGGTTIASFKNASSDFVIVTDVDDKDIIFKGQDDTSEITALTLDMSAAGLANFNNDVVAFYSSDERLKDNVVKIGDPLLKLSELRGVEFDWNDNKEVFAGQHSYGVIAQEVEKVLPEIVTERSDGYKAVKYELIVPLLIESIKELHKKVEHIEKNCECLNK